MKRNRKNAESIKVEVLMKRLEATATRPKMKIDISLRSGIEERQTEGIKIIANQMKAARTADTEEQTLIQSAIAVGYANAMRNNNLLSSEELEGILNMITKTAEDNRKLLQDISRTSVKRSFWKKVTA